MFACSENAVAQRDDRGAQIDCLQYSVVHVLISRHNIINTDAHITTTQAPPVTSSSK